MTTDPGDLVLDPTCGSGTTAYVAEQWGRRWITIDTSRVALALARARLMGARYPYYILKDSPAGQRKEAELTQSLPAESPTYGSVRQGFVYERVPHITLKSIANNSEIDVIWKEKQPAVVAALEALNGALAGHATPYRVASGGREGQPINFSATGSVTLPSGEEAPANSLLEWEVPREAPADWPTASHGPLAAFWQARIARQRAIDASIAAKADYEYLYDKPYEERNLVRVAGPFTVESLSPHRVLAIDADDRLIPHERFIHEAPEREGDSFSAAILESLRVAGVQQAHKADKISFTSLSGWPGRYICAEGHYQEASSGAGRRAGIFIGPEFGTVGRADLVAAAREAGDAGFDLLIACAFNYDAHAADFASLGRIPVLKARMNADLHMADALKNTGAGNLFVIFGEPDIDVTTGHWVTTRDGRPVAHYEQLCALTGLTSLDAINRTDPKQLHALCNRASRSATDGGRGNLQHTHLLRALNTLSAGDLPLSLSSSPKVQVTIHGVDIFRPNSGEVSSSSPEEIACWFIDSDYNEESFFVRQAYFLGAVDSYKALKSSLRAEIDEEAWASLYGSCSRPFDRPKTGRIAVKVINHLGDEVMKVFHVGGVAGEKRKEE